MHKLLVIVTMTVAMFTCLPAWALDLNPGRYEITVKVEMPGMPGGMPTQTTTQCLTAQDPVPATSGGGQGCRIEDMKTSGNTVTYTMVCEQQGMQSKSTGSMTYRGDTFEGSTRTEMGPSAGGMTVTTAIKGKRIGNCSK